jgi:hypothetical protein
MAKLPVWLFKDVVSDDPRNYYFLDDERTNEFLVSLVTQIITITQKCTARKVRNHIRTIGVGQLINMFVGVGSQGHLRPTKAWIASLSSASFVKKLYNWHVCSIRKNQDTMREAAYITVRMASLLEDVQDIASFDETKGTSLRSGTRRNCFTAIDAIAGMMVWNGGGREAKEDELWRETKLDLGEIIGIVVSEWSTNREKEDPRGLPGVQVDIRRHHVGQYTGVDNDHNKTRLSTKKLASLVKDYVREHGNGYEFDMSPSTLRRKLPAKRETGGKAAGRHRSLAHVVLRRIKNNKRTFHPDAYASNSNFKRHSLDFLNRLSTTYLNFSDHHTKFKPDIPASFAGRASWQIARVTESGALVATMRALDHSMKSKAPNTVLTANSHLIMQQPTPDDDTDILSDSYKFPIRKQVRVVCALESQAPIDAVSCWNDHWQVMEREPGLVTNRVTGAALTESAFGSDKGPDHNMEFLGPQILQCMYHLEKDQDRTVTVTRCGGLSAYCPAEGPQGALSTAVSGAPISSEFYGAASDPAVAAANQEHARAELVSRINGASYAFHEIQAFGNERDHPRFDDQFRLTFRAYLDKAQKKKELVGDEEQYPGITAIREAHEYMKLHSYAAECSFQLLRFACLRYNEVPCARCRRCPWRCPAEIDLPNFIVDIVMDPDNPGRLMHAEDLDDNSVPYPWIRGSERSFPNFAKEITLHGGGFPVVKGFPSTFLRAAYRESGQAAKTSTLRDFLFKDYALAKDDFYRFFQEKEVDAYREQIAKRKRIPIPVTTEQREVVKGLLLCYSEALGMENRIQSGKNLTRLLALRSSKVQVGG